MRKFRIGIQTYDYPVLFQALMSASALANRTGPYREQFDQLHTAIDGMMFRPDGELVPQEIRNVVHFMQDTEVPDGHPELKNFLKTVRDESQRIPELF